MIRYLSRILPVVLRAKLKRGRPKISSVRGWVRPSWIDVNLHLNQAIYAEIFENGRTDWVMASRLYQHLRDNGVNVVVAEQRIVYRRELRAFTRFRVDTRGVEVDGRLLCTTSHLLVGDRVHTICHAKLLFVGPEGVLPAERAKELTDGWLVEPLPVTDWVAKPA